MLRPTSLSNLLLALLLLLLLGVPARAAKEQRVALTMAIPEPTSAAEKSLAETLLALLEMETSGLPGITVVERTRIELALNELILDRAVGGAEQVRLQLGKLATADVILIMTPFRAAADLPPGGIRRDADPVSERAAPRWLIRIVEARTAVIRGATVARLRAEGLDEVAVELAHYLAAVLRAPRQARVTVAVAPFKSRGRFDRLRPLEFGVRDMLTAGLRKLNRFQVLQRSGMQQLNHEMNLLRSGLADREALPETLPSRKAAYLLHGTIDEQIRDGKQYIQASAELVRASTGRTELKLHWEATLDKFPEALARRALILGGHLARAAGAAATDLVPDELDEAEHMFKRAIRDARRFRRRSPIDFSYRRLELPQVERAPATPLVLDPASPLGRHLLRKSIDRLESVLFLYPERADAAYALGYCYSFHVPRLLDASRSAALLTTAWQRDPSGQVGARALELLAELNFHHESGREVRRLRPTSVERIGLAFEKMPPDRRNTRWVRLLSLLGKVADSEDEVRPLTGVLTEAAAIAEEQKSDLQPRLASEVARLAGKIQSVSVDTEVSSQLLRRWAESSEPVLRLTGCRQLGDWHRRAQQPLAAAEWYVQAVKVCRTHPHLGSPTELTNLLMHAGRSLRIGGRFEEALELLRSAKAAAQAETLHRGYVLVEIGRCLEGLRRPDQARQVYIEAAMRSEDTVNNTDVAQRILALGGVPLSPRRDVQIRYIPGPDKQPYFCRKMATDGSRLFCGGGHQGLAAQGVMAYDIARETWRPIGTQLGRVTCLVHAKGMLWAGTDGNGLWRYALASERWKQWTTKDGLPDDRVVSLAAGSDALYAGLGTESSGGLVRISPDGLHVYQQARAPRAGPRHIVVDRKRLLVSAGKSLHELNRTTGEWSQRLTDSPSGLFAGDNVVWLSQPGRELYRYGAEVEAQERYRQAWFPRGRGKAGYRVNFVVHRDGKVWFGGTPWQRFQSAGFYRLDETTGGFRRYGPADGFRVSTTYTTYDGVHAAGRLWIATSAGLAEVAERRVAEASGE